MLRSGETHRNIDELATKDCSAATQETGGHSELDTIPTGGVRRNSWGDQAAVVRSRNMHELVQRIKPRLRIAVTSWKAGA
jgi:hypothetical protein